MTGIGRVIFENKESFVNQVRIKIEQELFYDVYGFIYVHLKAYKPTFGTVKKTQKELRKENFIKWWLGDEATVPKISACGYLRLWNWLCFGSLCTKSFIFLMFLRSSSNFGI